jgi:hypothetical protein
MNFEPTQLLGRTIGSGYEPGALLANDVNLHADGGGKRPAATNRCLVSRRSSGFMQA